MTDSPPFRYHNAVIIQIILRAAPAALLPHVPAGVAFAPAGDFAWQVAHFPHVDGLPPYNEAALLLRGVHKGRLRLLPIRLWVDAERAQSAGRAAWSLPKAMGEIGIDPDGRGAHLRYDGAEVLHLRGTPRHGAPGNWNHYFAEAWLVKPPSAPDWTTLPPHDLRIAAFCPFDITEWRCLLPAIGTVRGASFVRLGFTLR